MQPANCSICLELLSPPTTQPYCCQPSSIHSFHTECWPGYETVPNCPVCKATPISTDALSSLSVKVGKKARTLEASWKADLEGVRDLFFQDLAPRLQGQSIQHQLESCLSSNSRQSFFSCK